MLWNLLTSLYYLLIVIFILLLLFIIILTGFRFYMEPVKGVCKCKTQMHGKTVLITGGTSGIGLETAKDLAKRGARVIIASIDIKISEEVVQSIKESSGNNCVEFRYLNLGKKDSIVKFAEEFNRDFDRLDILVNNAAAGGINKATPDGIDFLLQINYVGPFTLTYLLLDKLIASKPSRIVIVSSLMHRFGYFDVEDFSNHKTEYPIIRYSKTKFCNILWTRALARKLPDGVTANVLHPGLVKTNIYNSLPSYARKILFVIIDLMYKTPVEGAQTVIHLCVSPEVENVTGSYYMDCKKIRSSKATEDHDLAEKLWNKTMEVIKL